MVNRFFADQTPLKIVRTLTALLVLLTVLVTTAQVAEAQARLRGERYPETRLRYVRRSELPRYSTNNLRYAVSEIFARRGYVFKTPSLLKQFLQFSWYRPRPGMTLTQALARMTPIELANYRLMLDTIKTGGGGDNPNDPGDPLPPPSNDTATYRFPQTYSRLLTNSEIAGLSSANVRYALNEIYARHNYRFRDGITLRQFQRLRWYRPITRQTKQQTELRFNRYETRNVVRLNSELDSRSGIDSGN